MIKFSRKYVKLQLEVSRDVAEEKFFKLSEGYYSYMDLVNLIQNNENYLKFKRKINRPSSHKKEKIFQRDNFKCVECGSDKALELHHIIPLSEGGLNDDNNLQILCKKCHHRKHKSKYLI